MVSTNQAIQPAREPSTCFRQVFKNFRDATAALLDCHGAPDDVCEEVLKMVEALGDEHDGEDAYDGDLARKVLTRVFDLNDGDEAGETPTRGPGKRRSAPGDHHQILKTFRAATEALINRAELPVHSRDAVLRMMGEFGGDEAARAAREEAELAEDEALEAAERLADAFATIREYWGYAPAGLRSLRLDDLQNGSKFLNSVEWEDDPKSYRRVLFALLRSPERETA